MQELHDILRHKQRLELAKKQGVWETEFISHSKQATEELMETFDVTSVESRCHIEPPKGKHRKPRMTRKRVQQLTGIGGNPPRQDKRADCEPDFSLLSLVEPFLLDARRVIRKKPLARGEFVFYRPRTSIGVIVDNSGSVSGDDFAVRQIFGLAKALGLRYDVVFGYGDDYLRGITTHAEEMNLNGDNTNYARVWSMFKEQLGPRLPKRVIYIGDGQNNNWPEHAEEVIWLINADRRVPERLRHNVVKLPRR